MERHRAQLQDAAIEEQLGVQTAMREAGTKLQALADKRQRIEMDLQKKCAACCFALLGCVLCRFNAALLAPRFPDVARKWTCGRSAPPAVVPYTPLF